MKAAISNRILMPYEDIETYKEIKDKLHYKFQVPGLKNSKVESYMDVRRLNNDWYTIPVGRTDLIPEHYEVQDKRELVPVTFPDFKGKLRDSQEDILEETEDNVIVNAKPGFGKTFTSLAIAKKLGQKTLVIAHTAKLRQQWEEEVWKVFGIKPGVVGSGIFNTDSIITMSNIQTVKKYGHKFAREFGLVIMDECFDYETLVTTKEFGKKKIGTIVNNELSCSVKSWNGNNWEWKPVVRYFKNKQDWFIYFKFNNDSSLKCTENHTLYCYRNGNIEKDIAGNIIEGEYIVCEPNNKTLSLLNNDKDLILGCILGDGHLGKTTNGVRLKITHGIDQEQYIIYKKELLAGLISSEISEGVSGYSDKKIFQFSTKAFVDEENWHEDIYCGNSYKTSISENIAKQFTKRTWAILYQDDGSISIKTIQFHIYLDDKGTELLVRSLKTLFNVNAKVRKISKNGKTLNRIDLSVNDSYIFLSSIKKYIHPIMRYKFGQHEIKQGLFVPDDVVIFKPYSITKVTDVDFCDPTGGFRYNIEVEDNHNYLANGKLVSNCHHLPADTFKDTIDRLKARYKIGLSGTLRRKDGKHILLTDYISNDIIIPPKENVIDPIVKVFPSSCGLPGGKMPWANKVTSLLSDPDYIHEICMLAEAQAKRGHKVLVVGDRIDFLYTCADILSDSSICITSRTKDSAPLEKQLLSGEKPILFGTTSIFKEGISINPLSCLILGSPINNEALLEQLAGRIMRLHEGKKDPEIIDVKLKGNTGYNQFKTRIAFYLSENWKVVEI